MRTNMDNFKLLYQLADKTPYQPTAMWCPHAKFQPDPRLGRKIEFKPDPLLNGLARLERVGGFEPLSWSLEGSSATVDTIPA